MVVGATGSVGQHVVSVALQEGHQVRALVRKQSDVAKVSASVELAYGDLTDETTLIEAVQGVDAIVFTHGTYGSMKSAQEVDYGAVRNVLTALGPKEVRIALMTTIGTTDRKGAHDWKRRGEWLVRLSGNPYTIVRPAWFDCNGPDEHKLVMLQGDKALTGSPKDGVISRKQLAEVLVQSLLSDAALLKTFELHATVGEAQTDLEPLFSKLVGDKPGSVHATHDLHNMLIDNESKSVKADLEQVQQRLLARKKTGVDLDFR